MKCDATGCNAELSREDDEHWCGYDHNRVVNAAITDYKARLLEKIQALQLQFTKANYFDALNDVKKIVEEL